MGRRTDTAPELEDHQHLEWRLHWLVSGLILHEGLHRDAAAEAQRLKRAGLPLAGQVRGLEDFLAGRGLLARAERLIARLSSKTPPGNPPSHPQRTAGEALREEHFSLGAPRKGKGAPR